MLPRLELPTLHMDNFQAHGPAVCLVSKHLHGREHELFELSKCFCVCIIMDDTVIVNIVKKFFSSTKRLKASTVGLKTNARDARKQLKCRSTGSRVRDGNDACHTNRR